MEHGFEMADDMPRIIHGHEAYEVARTYWGREDGLSILKVLKPMLDAHVDAGRVEVFLETPADRLLVERDGVRGVVSQDGREIRAGAVVLASGGYAANAELFSRLHPGATLWSGSYHQASGRGIEMAAELGGQIVLN